jgi:thioredoxin reductase (NADPH)
VTALDFVIIGAGPTGLACAIEAQKSGLTNVVIEKGCLTNSIFRFPSQMVFFTTPELLEIGGLPLVCERDKPTRSEALKYYRRVVSTYKLDVHQFEEVQSVERIGEHQFRTHSQLGSYDSRNVVISTGYYDNPNLMGIPGEDLPHVSHYYSEPYPFFGRDVVVIGGKNSAAEAALDLFRGGARVSLIHRGAEMGKTVKYWVRPDIENRFKNGEIAAFMNSCVVAITPTHVRIDQKGHTKEIRADHVFALTGYHSSTKFFEQLGIAWDPLTLRPQYNSETYETNVPGVYLAGSVVGGRLNGEVFIENGRFHGQVVVEHVRSSPRGTRGEL